MSVTLRPRFVLGVVLVLALATLIAAVAGAGVFSLVGVGLVLVAAFVARQSLRLDDAGVRYRSLIPSEGFSLAWTDVAEVVVDVVNPGVPGSPSSPVARAVFVQTDGAPKSAMLFSVADGQRLLDACRERDVRTVDQRAPG